MNQSLSGKGSDTVEVAGEGLTPFRMDQSITDSLDTLEIRERRRPMANPPSELPVVPGGWSEREWTIEGQTLRLVLPASPDDFLEDAEVHAAFDRDEYMPYWAYLWPASLKMAATILRQNWPTGQRVLELGAGIGLVGLAGLTKGLHVTFSDYEPKSVELTLFNARRSGYEHVQGMVIDWRQPPAQQFPIIWGCELLYENRNHEPLLELTRQMLESSGTAWFVDGGRMHAERFWKLVPQYDLTCHIFDEKMNSLSSPRVGRYQLFEIRHADPLD
ncbi:MAG: hypothetical protein FJ267_13965 [Planctomycetes bacterium]|nr:hypothetical protein [Planctomycetota bacterium]